ncbi:hypothetical protein L209DRAFT_751517 [Thermothelomyces heterothallicus CBS 203.75]
MPTGSCDARLPPNHVWRQRKKNGLIAPNSPAPCLTLFFLGLLIMEPRAGGETA